MRGYCEEIFVDALDDRLIDLNPCSPKKNFAVPKRVTKHHGTIGGERLPELYNYLLSCNSSASFKACAVALVVSGLRVSNIALLLQKNYDAEQRRFITPMKTGEDDRDGLMKSGREYRGTFPDELRKMINDQMVEGHTHVFVSNYSGRHVNPESIRKLFKGFDKSMTSHGLRNLFKSWANNHDVPKFLADRYYDHELEGLDKAYRRYDTEEARADIAVRYFGYMTTGVTPASRQQPLLQVVA